MSNLQLVKSKNFGNIKCDFWQDDKGQIWMTREQIGRALEYSDPNGAIEVIHRRNHDRLDKFSTTVKLTGVEGTREVTREMTVYTYKGIYEICRFSRQPKADAFMDWVWEVVESIRKTGMYLSPKIDSKMLYQIAQALEEKEKQIALLTPKAQSYDILMDASGCLTMDEVAKTLDIKGIGRNNLFKLLVLEKIIYKKGDVYLPMQEYKSHFIVKQNPIRKGDAIIERSQLFMTTKGLDWLAHKLIDKGYQVNYYKGKTA
jgi:prophage antirepressor-like protein